MNEHPAFDFTLEYGGELVYCAILIQETGYDIHFNGGYVASLQHTGDMTWLQSAGVPLPEEIINYIGGQIESEYR